MDTRLSVGFIGKILRSVLLVFCATSLLAAQDQGKRYSEEEITIEKEFIEAKKYKLLGDIETANELFKKILKKYSTHDAAAYELADSYNRAEEYVEAVRHINLAIDEDPANKWYLKLKADILSNDKMYKEAAEVYDQLIAQQPKSHHLLEKKAYLCKQAGDLNKAISVLDQLDEKIGINEKTSMIKHDLYDQLGKKSKAVEVLNILIARFPLRIGYRHKLAQYLKKVDKKKQADQVYKDILAIEPRDPRAQVAMAENYKRDEESEDYLAAIRSVIVDDKVAIDLKIDELMPYVRKLQRENDQSIVPALTELVTILEQIHPEDAKPYALHGDILSLIGDHEGASAKYAKTLSIDDSKYLVWEQMLTSLVELGDYQKLYDASNQAIEIFPNQARIFYLNGLAAMQIKAYEDAIGSLEQARFMAARDEEMQFSILALLGHTSHLIKDYRASDEAFDEALRIKPNDANVLNDYSTLLADRGERLQEAEQMNKKALAKSKSNPRFWATQGWIYYRQQKLSPALEAFEKALRYGGDQDANILEKFGDTLYKSDQTEKALKYWRVAAEKGGGSKWLQRKITEKKLIEAQ
ncbi:MAG: tetratricopeptide repeat protein [Saprospiraceae bacterium]|nr:tetratricopeptide repeat protein [Saprospiraceae bacterium]